MPEYYRRPSAPIRAVQYLGDPTPVWDELGERGIDYKASSGQLEVLTEQAKWVPVDEGEWVIAAATEGRFYPCDPAEFAERFQAEPASPGFGEVVTVVTDGRTGVLRVGDVDLSRVTFAWRAEHDVTDEPTIWVQMPLGSVTVTRDA